MWKNQSGTLSPQEKEYAERLENEILAKEQAKKTQEFTKKETEKKK